MFSLSAAIPMPNVNRWRVARWMPAPNESRSYVEIEVLSPGATPRMLSFMLEITNGECDQLVVNALALKWDDSFKVQKITKPTGYTDFDAAAQGTGQNRVRAIETFLATGYNADPALSTAIVSIGAGAVS